MHASPAAFSLHARNARTSPGATLYLKQEASISPFELLKADELFISNVIQGLQPVGLYRKKMFKNTVSSALVERLNAKIGAN